MRRIAIVLSVLATLGSLAACSGDESLTGVERQALGSPQLQDGSPTEPSSNN